MSVRNEESGSAVTLHTYATIGGYKSHYSTDGNTTLCGREVSNATSGIDMCKTCDKRAAKLTEAETAETTETTAPAAPVEPTADVFDMSNLTDAQMTVLETNIGRVPEVIANALAAVAHGSTHAAEHRATYYTPGTTVLRADVDPAAYSSAVVNANDTAREEGWERRTADWFDCLDYSYESMRVENESARQRAAFYAEQDAETADAAPFEPYAAHVRWAVGPVATPEQRDAKLARIEADAAAGTLPTNVAEWGWSAEELASVKATAEANAAAPEPSDVQDDAAALEAALEAAESHLSPLSRAHAPARAHADSMGEASVSNYPRVDANGHTVWACCESSIGEPCQHRTGPRELREPMVVVEPSRTDRRKVVAWLLGLNTSLRREFRADRSTPLHVAYWAQTHGVRPATGKRFNWEKHETLSLARASF